MMRMNGPWGGLETSIMADIFFIALMGLFAALSLGLLVLCERLMGDKR